MNPTTRINRRRTLKLMAAGVALGTGPSGWAQAVFPQPGKPIRILVPLAAGGSLDFQARSIGQKITEQSGLAVVVENKPGASMMLAAQELMRSAPDGHTVMYSASSIFAQNPHTLSNVPYDPFKDFTPITMSARGPLVLTVWSGMPVKSVADLIAWAKANPGKLVFGSFGMGTSSHVYAEAFAKRAGIEMVHVPYKGTADAVKDLFEGRVMAYFDAAPTAISNDKTGKVRMLAVAAPVRNKFMPQVPTFTELGLPGLDVTSWVAIVGPANIPADILAAVNKLFVQAIGSQAVTEAIARGAYETDPGPPQALAKDIRESYDRWGAMIKAMGMPRQ